MDRAKANSCSRCGSEITLSDRFCQECGLDLPGSAKVSRLENTLDFTPPAKAVGSHPDSVDNRSASRAPVRPEPAKLHSPLLNSEVIDCTPTAIPGHLLPDQRPRVQRPGAALTEFHNKQERERLRSRLIPVQPDSAPLPGPIASADQGELLQSAELPRAGGIATLEPESPTQVPPSRPYSTLLSRHASDNSPSTPGLPGPLLDLLQASIVLLTLTAIAFYVGQNISKWHRQSQTTATQQLEALVKQGQFTKATRKSEVIRQVAGNLNQAQADLMNEAYYQQAKLALDKGSRYEAQTFLHQIDSTSPRFNNAHSMLVLMSSKIETTEEVVPKPRKPAVKWIRRVLSDKQDLSLPPLLSPASDPESAIPRFATTNSLAAETSTEAPPDQAADSTKTAAHCSERDIAAYNRMLARWVSHNKMPEGPAKITASTEEQTAPRQVQSEQEEASQTPRTDPPDPPSFREWLKQGKPKF